MFGAEIETPYGHYVRVTALKSDGLIVGDTAQLSFIVKTNDGGKFYNMDLSSRNIRELRDALTKLLEE